MNAENFDLDRLLKMAHSPISNYVIPGLTSYLIGNPSPNGTLRLFRNEREHQETVTPHSHRFNFQCWVLRGSVRNRIWTKSSAPDDAWADLYRVKMLTYQGSVGEYVSTDSTIDRWRYRDDTYAEGQFYAMDADEVHSIWFSRGAIVLFFEGPTCRARTMALEPVVGGRDGEVIPTLKVEPWMFQRQAAAKEDFAAQIQSILQNGTQPGDPE